MTGVENEGPLDGIKNLCMALSFGCMREWGSSATSSAITQVAHQSVTQTDVFANTAPSSKKPQPLKETQKRTGDDEKFEQGAPCHGIQLPDYQGGQDLGGGRSTAVGLLDVFLSEPTTGELNFKLFWLPYLVFMKKFLFLHWWLGNRAILRICM